VNVITDYAICQGQPGAKAVNGLRAHWWLLSSAQ